MSGIIEDPFFKQYKKYSFILDLPLYAIYSYFYTPIEGYEHNSSCENEIVYKDVHTTKIREVCKSIKEHLPNLQGLKETHELSDVNKVCEYYSYWIYDKIKHINNSHDNIQSLYNAINTLKSRNNLDNKCSNIENYKISADKFNEKKELFFHTENLFLIEKKYNKIQNKDSSLYEKYLEECAEYYKKIMLNNYCKNKEDYKSELINFSTNFNRTKNFLKEQNVQIPLEDLKSPDIFECTPASKIHRGGGDDSLDGDVDDAGTDPGTIAGTGLGISFVILLSYVFLYKFKGYQNFIRPLIEKEKNLLNNLEDENNEIIQIPDPNRMNLDNTSYNINYHYAQDY
ncbi:PIR Superfamily Protein [Plasmodium ovale wallikeri]|uniref:PIR Superfamily Protein n=1 Tax=Plasmodium ovale wallikeri TaxID=864142 RepID=A0A1A9ANL1_PLAOA|nr:PIR Superfamily Protein [Plasmodium ovale wallikeri]SBT58438.1 PIR Superfamily Protein [Plasmodium ovale wallikeri]